MNKNAVNCKKKFFYFDVQRNPSKPNPVYNRLTCVILNFKFSNGTGIWNTC